MAWTYTTTPVLDEVITVAWGLEIQNAIKQLAADIYITPANGGDGNADLAYPLQNVAPVFSSHVNSGGTAGTVVTLPASYAPSAATDYEVQCTYQADPGGNGAIWVEKGTSNFTIKNYGTKVVAIAYTIVRKTA